MSIACFPSLPDAEVIEVVFVKPGDGEIRLRLLVDSGFTGQSCFVLPESMDDFAHAPAAASNAAGALQGTQMRAVVVSRIEPLSFQISTIAILADTSLLALPPGVQGMVGLRYLRSFRRWGGERLADGTTQFFLEVDDA
jgi:predicted aspartyl protease